MRTRTAGWIVVFAAAVLPCLSYAQTYSKTETIEYSDNLSSWVLGQVKRTTTNGAEVSRTDYDKTTALPMGTYSFGALQQSFTYNADGTVATVKDGNNNVTRLGNYKRGVPQLIQFPATPDQPSGTSMTAAVDDLGLIRSVVDQNGAKTCYDYDAMGRVTRIQYPSETTPGQCGGSWSDTQTSFMSAYPAAYGLAAGQWRQQKLTGSLMTETFFDGLWRPVVKRIYDVDNVNATMSQSVIRYDANGNVVFESYPQPALSTVVTDTWADPTKAVKAQGTTSDYDALNRVISIAQDAEPGLVVKTTMRYLAGYKKEVTDPKHNITTIDYLAYDEPTTDWPVRVAAPLGVTQVIARDAYGKPLSITQSGPYGTEIKALTKTLVYDSHQRLCRTTEPESGSTVINYDNASNVHSSASGLAISGTGCGSAPASSLTNFTYDAMNRTKTILPPVGTQSTSYGYDPAGRPTSAVSGISTWNGNYNFRGLLTGESLQLAGQSSWSIGYAYDANGQKSLVHYPDGENVSYAPDALGRPTQVGSYASNIGYFPNGQVSQFIYGNGTGYIADQNARQLPSNFSYGGAATLQLSEDLSYDANGNVTAVTDQAKGPRTKSFGYDALNRLTSATATGLWGTQTFSYDALNNLRTLQTGSQTSAYNYDAYNRLTGISGAMRVSYTYDPRGNVATKNSTSLVFDQKNQLTQIPGIGTYAYDAAGRRVSKTTGNANTYYFYSQAGQLMYQVVPATLKSTDFIYLGTKLIARADGYSTHVVGNVDGVALDSSNNASLRGWACSTGMTASINVEVFAGGPSGGGGTRIATAVANVASEPAVATACQSSGTAYRFTISLTAAVRNQYPDSLIYMYGDSPVGAGNLQLGGSGVYKVPPNISAAAPTLSAPPTSASGSYTVSWGSVSGAISYTLQEQVNGGGWTTIQTSSATSDAITGKPSGTYGYRVQGCNVGGCGPWSRVASTAVLFPPAPPASITIPGASSGTVAVSWAASATATSYTLQHAIYGVTGWSTIYSGGTTSRSQNETTTGSWIYQVQACNAAGCSAFRVSGGRVTVTIPPASAPSLSMPTTSVTGSYTVSWGGVSGASSYTLQEQLNSGSWSTVQSTGATSKAIGGKGNGRYGYHVQACNAGGCGPWSAVGTITVTHLPSAPPAVTAPSYVHGTPYTIGWTASAGSTSYNVRRTDLERGGAVIVGTTASTHLGMPAPTGSTTLQYAVQACNAAGCSGFTNAANTTYTDRKGTIQSVKPPPPGEGTP